MSKSRFLFFALFFASTAAFAQETFKCNIGGSWVYQDRPCPGSSRRAADMPAKGTAIDAKPAAPKPEIPQASPSAVSPASDLERQKAFLAKGAKDRRVSNLRYDIERTESLISQQQANMNAELAALDRQKASANNNLAGATYLNSLATEQQAIATRYQVEITTQRERLKQLQEQLVAATRE